MKTKLIVVAGPTASGKTALGIALAKALNGEIICADSMQVYRSMPIATAAPTPEETAQAPHHLNEILSPSEDFSVARFCEMAGEAVKDICGRGKVPIIVGGTGLFIDSFIDNIQFTKAQTDFELREKLSRKDNDELYAELEKVDPEAAAQIHKNNKVRVVRALELYYTTGATKTTQNDLSRQIESPYEALYFVLDYSDRELLYQRINKRVDLMLEKGLVEEAKKALASGGRTSRQAIGHKELKPYFDGECSLEEAVENLKRETRRYAKRQLTWFRRRQDAVWIYADKTDKETLYENAIQKAKDFLNGKNESTKKE